MVEHNDPDGQKNLIGIMLDKLRVPGTDFGSSLSSLRPRANGRGGKQSTIRRTGDSRYAVRNTGYSVFSPLNRIAAPLRTSLLMVDQLPPHEEKTKTHPICMEST
jgi:hypothetical protein